MPGVYEWFANANAAQMSVMQTGGDADPGGVQAQPGNGFRDRGYCVTEWTGSKAAPARTKTCVKVAPCSGDTAVEAGSGGARRQTLHENGAQKQRRPGRR
jgi:hypothetical protein